MSDHNLTDKQLDDVRVIVVNMFKLMARESENCHLCGSRVESIEQVGKSVYANPCGCRLWQGLVPDAWKPNPPAP